MKQQHKMLLVLSDFIGNASSGSATLVQGKQNEIQQQCRPIPDKFPHQGPGKAVLVENNFSTSSPPFYGMAIREAFLSIFTAVV